MRTNAHGNTIEDASRFGRERYYYDEKLGADWSQYDTNQDASYFGVWVNAKLRQVMTFTEGDESLTTCPTVESFQKELDDMAACYGPTPAHVRAIGASGTVELIDERPGVDHDANQAQKADWRHSLAAMLG